jgi:hypothetical protein
MSADREPIVAAMQLKYECKQVCGRLINWIFLQLVFYSQ